MARIIGGIVRGHSPAIGFAFDKNRQDDPMWTSMFEAYKPVHRGIRAPSIALDRNSSLLPTSTLKEKRSCGTLELLNLTLWQCDAG